MNIPLPIKRYDPRLVRNWANIDLATLTTNIKVITTAFAPVSSNSAIMAIVKADAYGHGAVAVTRTSVACGIKHFGVATIEEGLILRKSGVRSDIYLLSPFVPDEAEAIVRGDLIPFLSSPVHFQALADVAKYAPLPARAFLVVDTGMGREGMLPGVAASLWHAAKNTPQVRLTGITSHLACADECGSEGELATRIQRQAFTTFVQSIATTFQESEDGRGNSGIYLSLCNSPGTLHTDEFNLLPNDLPGVRGVLHRAGLLLYGIEPYKDAFIALPSIKQALTWQARITLIRDLPEGATIGYGRTYTLNRASRIATVAVGYADGFPRRLSNRGTVLFHGQPLPIVGRVSMDQLQIDITDSKTPIDIGEVVTLLGADTETTIAILAFADSIEATAHEPTCYLTSRVSRLYTGL